MVCFGLFVFGGALGCDKSLDDESKRKSETRVRVFW